MQISLFQPAPAAILRPKPVRAPAPIARWYQEEAVEAIAASLGLDGDPFGLANRSALVVLATGLGKTQIASGVVERVDGRCLWLAHRTELLDQARERLELVTGEPVEIEKAHLRAGDARIVVASVQTMAQQRRLEEWGKDDFALVVFDEAHHAPAVSYRRPLDYFNAKVLGLTATPDRADERALGKIFDDVPYIMDIAEGINAGYLVPIDGQEVLVEEVNLDGVGTSMGDLVAKQLDEAMVAGVEGFVKKTSELLTDKQAICFTPGVKTAHLAAERMNAIRPMSSAAIDGTTPDDRRAQVVEDFRRGKIRYLWNCMIATEGFDAPGASAIVMARPTKSRALYAQMMGRGLRPEPGVVDGFALKEDGGRRREAIAASVKPMCKVLDFVGNNTKHSLINSVDVLGGNYSEAEIAVAKKKTKASGGNPFLMLEAAREEMRKLAQATRSRVRASVRGFDPFAVLHLAGDETRVQALRFGNKPMTEGQYNTLRKFKVHDDRLKGLSFAEASRLIGALIARSRRGLATHGQLAVLQKQGVTNINVSFARASAAIDYLKSQGWGHSTSFSQAELHRIIRMRMPGEDG